jgi:F0F1-type ATP synthase assembly protein I
MRRKLEPLKKTTSSVSGKDIRFFAKLAFVGSQMAITIGLFVWLGWWLDKRNGWMPWGTVGCGILGIAIGFYQFFREVSSGE